MVDVELGFKVMGSIFVLIGSISFGLFLGKEWENNCEEYGNLKLILINLERNCDYIREPFPQLFQRVATQIQNNAKGNSVVASETEKLGKSLPNTSIQPAWNQYVENVCKRMHMNEGIKQQLLRLGDSLQSMDVAGFQMQIEAGIQVLEDEMRIRRKELREKKRVGLSCCLMVGLFTVIIFI